MEPVGGNAGNRSGDLPRDSVEITDHTGRYKQRGASCKTIEHVNEKKVNGLLVLGKTLGRWGPTNQCQSFVSDVLVASRTPSWYQERMKRILNSLNIRGL